MPALIYTIVSCACFLIDLISFFVLVGISGALKSAASDLFGTTSTTDQPTDVQTDEPATEVTVDVSEMPAEVNIATAMSLISLFQLFLVMAYTLVDFFFVYWVTHWYFKLPKPLSVNVPMALMGFGSKLRAGFSADPVLAKQAQG